MMLSNVVLAAILSLSNTNPSVKIEFHQGKLDDDVAQAKRYIGATYDQTKACVVTFDKDNFLERIERKSDWNVKIDKSKFYDFVLLHEMAHCFDDTPEPSGVDPIEWREFLADVYSTSELYAAKVITEEDYSQLIKLRQSHPEPFKINALEASRNFVKERTLNYGATKIEAAKLYREVFFAENSIALPQSQ